MTKLNCRNAFRVFSLLSFVLLWSSSGEASPRTGEFKGYYSLNQTLKNRFVKTQESMYFSFSFARFFGQSEDGFGFFTTSGLSSLLGGYQGTGLRQEFRNGNPNAVNVLLLTVGVGLLARAVSEVCLKENDYFTDPAGAVFSLYPEFAGSLRAICHGQPQTEEFTQSLENIWLHVAAFDMSSREAAAFVDYFNRAINMPAEPTQRAVLVVSAILLNPMFLLQY